MKTATESVAACASACRYIAVLVFSCCLAVAPNTRASILDWIFPKHDVHVITVTDTTPAGALRRPASPEKPIYYAAINVGYKDFGGIIAGEKIPPKEEVLRTIAKVLAKQGYLPATNEHAPTLLLVWTWGTMNTDRLVMISGDEGPQTNRRQLLRFLGAYKLGLISKDRSAFQDDLVNTGALFRDADQEMIYDLASEDLYVAAISAYDYGAATRNEKVLLWMTKIACPSRGLAMNETLPTMLALAGPHIGRETEKPVSIKATEKFKPDVKIGDPTMVEFIEKNPLPVFDAPSATRSDPHAKQKRKQ